MPLAQFRESPSLTLRVFAVSKDDRISELQYPPALRGSGFPHPTIQLHANGQSNDSILGDKSRAARCEYPLVDKCRWTHYTSSVIRSFQHRGLKRLYEPMKNPPHPGKVVRVSCLEPLGLNVTEGAKVLGVSRQALSNVVNGRARLSTDMAVRLAKAFGSTTETWIRVQAAYDVAQARAREDEIEVARYEPRPAAGQ